MTTEIIEGQVVDPADVPADAEALSFKDMLSRFASIDAFEKALGDFVKRERQTVFAAMAAKQDEDGTKSFNVMLDGEVAATATITDPQPRVVVKDEEAFTDWVMDHYPTEVETVPTVRPAFQKRFLDKLIDHDENGVFVKESGEEVPGLKHVPAGQATTFSTRWKSQDKKADMLDRLFVNVAPLLGIEAGESK